MWVQSLGREDHLKEEMATHSSILAWRIPWTETPGGLEFMGLQSRTRLSEWTELNWTELCVVKAMVFPVIMYGCESWIIKKADRQRIDAFELWSQRRLLRVPWPERRSNQSILKEINPEYSLKGLTLKLKLQYFGYLRQWAKSLEDSDAGKDWRQEEKGMTEDEMVGWHHWLNGHKFERASGDGEGQSSLACCRPWVWKSGTWLSGWTTKVCTC